MDQAERLRHQRQERAIIWVVGGLVATIALIMLINVLTAADEQPTQTVQPSTDQASHNVVYEVDGSAIEVSVTLSTPTGTQQMDANARLAGDDLHEMTVDSGEFLYISAQNQNELGTIACRIIVDGAVIAENESTASYGIASCEGSAR